MLKILAWLALAGGAGVAVLAPAAAAVMSSAWGRDVILIAPHAPEAVEINKLSWSKGDPVPPIYGIPTGGVTRIVFAKADRVVVPSEDPSITLYRVDKQAGDNPLQAQTLWFFAKWFAIGGGSAAVVGLGLVMWLRTRRAPASP